MFSRRNGSPRRLGVHGFLLLASAALIDPFAAAAVELDLAPYVGIAGGVHFWPAYSNRDEVEADTEPGYSWSALVGLEVAAPSQGSAGDDGLPPIASLERFSVRFDVGVGQRFSPIHGINDSTTQRTGDGKTLQATSLHLNAWPGYRVSERWRIYAGAGGGGTWLRALGSDKRVWSAEVGLGAQVDLPTTGVETRLDIGWRSFFANSTKLRDALADFDAHGVTIGLFLLF